jgi:2-polyprenyl-3-methyl-5-hydroxy-6-metoxy-1,4-benzoquinol methylase
MTSYEIAVCPVCRSEQSRVIADQDAIKAELEWLWQFHLRRLSKGAPIDQLFDRAFFSQQPPLQVVQCVACGTVFRNPREREQDVIDTYQQEATSPEALQSLFDEQYAFYQPRMAELARMRGRRGHVLEVGSYLGAFLQAAEQSGWRAHGIDVNASATDFARGRGCTVTESSLEAYQSNHRYDVVALWNCFDQLPEPQEALEQASSVLADDGLIAIRVPNGNCYAHLRSLPASIGRPLLAWNNLATFPYRHGFTPGSLKRLLAQHGFEVVQLKTDTLVSIAGSWTRGWARWEERILKATLKLLPRTYAPWFEVYARRISH